MKQILLLFLFLIFCTGYHSEKYSVNNLEKIFAQSLPQNKGIIYTKVPRGLVISFNEHIFFNENETKIKENSLYILNIIANILKQLPNQCIIEDHIREQNFNNLENWEVSMTRASSISEYLIKYEKVPQEQLFDIGFGNMMPFYDNVAPLENNATGFASSMDNRVDFVIIEYEAKR